MLPLGSKSKSCEADKAMGEINPTILIVFLLQIGVMLAVGLFFGQLMRYLKQPTVLGELIGGIVLGPTVFGLLFPTWKASLFPVEPQINEAREGIIRLGMLFFMFVAGLEVNLSQLRQRKQTILLVSLFGSLLPFGLGVASLYWFPSLWGNGSLALDNNFALFVGIALSISALPVITRILMELKLLQTVLGSIIMTSATINDLVGWTLFALLLSNLNHAADDRNLVTLIGLIVLFAVAVVGIGRWLVQPLLQWVRLNLVWPSGFIGVCAVLIFVTAAVAEMLHIHAIFGAFLMGVALYATFEQQEASQAKEIIHQFAISLFAPLYFVSVGLKADFVTYFDWQLVLLILVLATVGKVVGATAGARLSGMPLWESLAIGTAMNARGAMEMILASLALEFKLIDERVFVALVTMALVTSMLSGPGLQWLLQRRE